ncbi:hypothetical protein GF339_18860 [candidate division KSB3 bacterium]|uniref:Zinc finger/thioredoxin putative domain-containing protein n=1 Tax=candidate division KSB3 bacterium TaxID=2044937 RepID=A0A9D5Q7T9_9BACT|nr:hypothetical protein [candidate division KSB3 bacterium]MBD3326652.1 hypothetical protein [candidate division KSB3 bacterium]
MAQSLTLKSISPKLRIVKPKTPPKDAPVTKAYHTTRVTALEGGLNLNRQDGGLVKYADISLLLVFRLDADPDTWYLEVFVYGQAAPFRLSQKVINYRQFLPQVSQRSKDNFAAFLLYLINQLDSVYIDENTLEFLKTQKVISYPDFSLFEEYTRQLWFQLMTWMKFRCEHCGEVYWVDESKVTEQGAKTKCVKCQQIITVKKRPKPEPFTSKEARKTVSCPHCQYENPEGSQFCVMCQKPLVSFTPTPKPQAPPSRSEPAPQQAPEAPPEPTEQVPSPAPDLSTLPLQARTQIRTNLSLREIALSLQEDINTLENKFAWFTKFSKTMQVLGFVFLIGGILIAAYIYFVIPNPEPPEVFTSQQRLTYAGMALGTGFLLSLASIIVSNIISLNLEIERNTKVTALLIQRLLSKQE